MKFRIFSKVLEDVLRGTFMLRAIAGVTCASYPLGFEVVVLWNQPILTWILFLIWCKLSARV